MPTGGGDDNVLPTATPAGASNTGANLNTPATVTKDAPHGTKKYGEPLFGPSIGSVSSGPGWTLAGEKKIMTDELTTEIVNGWIEKSKEPSNPTTTLQALVNLKRPTLHLSPLSSSLQDEAPATDQHLHLHGLEFTYDCDAPKCGIYVYVHLTKDHPDAPPTQATLAKLQVFEITQDGGFGNKLTIEDGAVLELERFEYVNGAAVGGGNRDRVGCEEKMGGEEPLPIGAGDGTVPLNGSNVDVTSSRVNVAAGEINNNGANNNNNNHRRRFSHFNFRKLQLQRRVTGPALTVVDAERNVASQSATAPNEAKAAVSSKTKDGDGVKVTIRLVALDEQGTELESPNEQIIYLHIVRESTRSDVDEEDLKPWVVKVVKREATIGPHTFHLHEIYGLSSYGSGPETTPAAHTYPPDAAIPPLARADDETVQSECLLCLSSPREVVLLPCRHLVACKECALNMVEYGAGGNITYGAEPAGGANATEEGTGGIIAGSGGVEGNGSGGGNAPMAATSPTAAIANARRKRKAKGWFCPVCREPYTSMLRLTTTAPSPTVIHEKGDGDGSGSEDEGEVEAPVHDATDNQNNNANTSNNSPGGFGFLNGETGGTGFFRNGFLRTFSGRGREAPTDVENQNQNPSSGA